jgi:hypothetical protein
MARIESWGLSVDPPKGWDAAIYRRAPEAPGPAAGAATSVPETPMPILHLANFPLPAQRGDYGGGAVEQMGSGAVFLSILEHHPAEAASPLFAGRAVPWPLRPDQFDPAQMQRMVPNCAGHQSFFVVHERAFCLYAVIGSFRARVPLTAVTNDALATVGFG